MLRHLPQAPAYLPYRLRNWVDQQRLLAALRGLDRTRPISAAQPEQAQAEAHMLLCRRDVRSGVLALKSLLRFPAIRWAVTLSDDGSLRPADRAWVDRLVPGCRWLSWPAAGGAVEQRLGGYPKLLELYHSRYAPVCKLLHPLLLARCRHVLVLDPDTAFFAPPRRLHEWVTSPDQGPLYLHDHQDEAAAVPPQVHDTFARLAAAIAPPHRSWRLPHRLFNSGLLAYRPEQLDLSLAEKYLVWLASAPAAWRSGKAAIWFGAWTPEQTAYMVLFALTDPSAQPLGDDYHLGGATGHVFNHFLRHYLIQQGTLRRLHNLVQELTPRS